MTTFLPPASRTSMSGRSRPSSVRTWLCSTKSTCSTIPAASTTLRSWISPHRPRTWPDLSAVPRWVGPERSRSETTHLVTVLRSSQVRGRWGEIQLRRVVEAAGMVEHVDFVEQSRVRTDDGRLRPDMLVRLAGGKNVVIDAKVAFLGYLDAVQAQDDTVRAERMAAHAR